MIIDIQVDDEFIDKVDEDTLCSTAATVLEIENCDPEAEMTIVIEDNVKLRELNLQFREIDTPTDVLSFPADEVDPETGNTYLGDIIISYPIAAEQAEKAGHPILDEIQLLVIHGTLHLLGYDHATQEEKEEMWNVQSNLLTHLHLNIRSLPE